ncbi:3D domain-containing protein [Sporomusa termitida]|uniref:3D domain-containing protein n=1 Tax=Sporomusa termitida TaxID=2377 RepID=UPI002482B7DD|nr:3D domain-containing protein [Sporomusa termitida]
MNKALFAIILCLALLLSISNPLPGTAVSPPAAETQQVIVSSPAATEAEEAAGPPEPPPLTMGMRGDKVRVVQKLLADGGFYAGNIDGVYGPITANAVRAFQRSTSLEITGTVDRETFTYLERATGEPSRYSRSLLMKASAYTAHDPGNGSYTYRGNLLRRGMAAVDPTVIPLGTRLYIKGYGYAIADDIGGAIKGQRIDLAFENRREALNFGVRKVTVYILD